jgi:hypothetical protein
MHLSLNRALKGFSPISSAVVLQKRCLGHDCRTDAACGCKKTACTVRLLPCGTAQRAALLACSCHSHCLLQQSTHRAAHSGPFT